MSLKWFQQSARRACVVGLDGVPASMIRRFTANGVMPRMAALMAAGASTEMTVSLPEISSVSWTTFMTGRNPGEHGIFGFTDLHRGTYKMSFPSFREVKCDTIFERMAEQKIRSVVINQPATYPARPIHGAIISGFVSVHLDKSVFPARYFPELQRVGYEVDLDAHSVKDDPELLFKQLHALLDHRRRAMEILCDGEDWNFLELIVTGTDRLHHFLMDAYEDTNHPHHAAFLDYYRAVDALVGETVERFDATARDDARNLFILSDHGFCRTDQEAYMNHALSDAGYLRFTRDGADSLEDISEAAAAFCLDPARIYLHRRGKYPRGSVSDAKAPALKAELTAFFRSLKDADGAPIIRHVFDAENTYSGPEAAHGPDLLLVPRNGIDLKGRLNAPGLTGPRRLQGMHTWDDAFFFTRRRDLFPTDTSDFNLVQIPGMILESVGVA